MDRPGIKNILKDSGKNVEYHILAYRKLTHEEMLLSAREYHVSNKKKKLKPSTIITIETLFGYNE